MPLDWLRLGIVSHTVDYPRVPGLSFQRDLFHMKKAFGEFDKSKPGSAA